MEIRIIGLCKKYVSEGKEIHALDHVDLTIPANRIFTLLGPSGCGKTTLLRCIVGLETPDAGQIMIGDEIVWSSDQHIFVPPERRKLGMVFQTYAIWPHMSVFDNVAFPLQAAKAPKEEIRRQVAKALEFVQMEGFEQRSATKLSGGQQQRVALARALVAEPKVILFDEPLSNLDAKLREETRKELRRFLTELRITAVYVTHDRIEALSLSDIVAVMKAGRIEEIGPPKKIYFDSEHRFVADFIGRANLIDATVNAVEDDTVILETNLGAVACRKRDGSPPGERVTLCVRPEFITVLPATTEDGRNIFRGIVESMVFVGDIYEVEARSADTVLLIRMEPDTTAAEGDEIALFINPNHCIVLHQ